MLTAKELNLIIKLLRTELASQEWDSRFLKAAKTYNWSKADPNDPLTEAYFKAYNNNKRKLKKAQTKCAIIRSILKVIK